MKARALLLAYPRNAPQHDASAIPGRVQGPGFEYTAQDTLSAFSVCGQQRCSIVASAEFSIFESEFEKRGG